MLGQRLDQVCCAFWIIINFGLLIIFFLFSETSWSFWLWWWTRRRRRDQEGWGFLGSACLVCYDLETFVVHLQLKKALHLHVWSFTAFHFLHKWMLVLTSVCVSACLQWLWRRCPATSAGFSSFPSSSQSDATLSAAHDGHESRTPGRFKVLC